MPQITIVPRRRQTPTSEEKAAISNTCFSCGFWNEKGVCQQRGCIRCPHPDNERTLAQEQWEMIKRLLAAGVQVREIVLKKDASEVCDTERGFFSYSRHGVHSLRHYIETRIVAPMSSMADPDLNTFKAYWCFPHDFGMGAVALKDVIKKINDHYDVEQEYYFKEVERVLSEWSSFPDKF